MRVFGRQPLYEGPQKIVYEGPEPGTFVQHFKDFSPCTREEAVINGRGIINKRISELLLQQLNYRGLPTYFIRGLNMREQLVRALEPIPIQLHIRNVVDEEMAAVLNLDKGTHLPRGFIEFYTKVEDRPMRLISPDHLTLLGWALEEEIDTLQTIAFRANDFLSGYLSAFGIQLVDFKLEFGRHYMGQDEMNIVIAESITPDTCQFWDIETGINLTAMGEEGYIEIAQRLGILPRQSPTHNPTVDIHQE